MPENDYDEKPYSFRGVFGTDKTKPRPTEPYLIDVNKAVKMIVDAAHADAQASSQAKAN